jgi:DNA modification methylase
MDELVKLGLNLKVVHVDELCPHPQNYNRHSDEQVGELGESLDRFAQYKNIVAWKESPDADFYWIIAGEGLWRGAKKRGLERIVINDRSDLSRDGAMALMISDNFTPSTDFDFEVLAPMVQELGVESVPGVDDVQLGEILAQVNGDQPDEPVEPAPPIDKAEELQAQWGVADGDIWQAGPHFVICGDCREPETWRRLLNVAGVGKVNGAFTSPPYAEQRKKQYGGVPTGEYVDWWEAVQSNVRANLADDGSFFVNIKPHCEKGERVLYVFDLVLAMKRRWGWRFVDELCWKRNSVPGGWNNRFKNAFEPIYHFCRDARIKFNAGSVSEPTEAAFVYSPDNPKSATGFFSNRGRPDLAKPGMAYPDNVIMAGAETGLTGVHSAPFPVALPDFFVRAYSDLGDTWIDPFCGSGTVLAACHSNDRRGLGIEVLPKYCAVILERLADLGLMGERIDTN